MTAKQPNNPKAADYLDSSLFHVRIYQELDNGAKFELPHLSASITDYEFSNDELEDYFPYEDAYFPMRGWEVDEDGDEDEDSGTHQDDSTLDDSGMEDDQDDYESEDDENLFVTLTYLVNRKVIQEIHGAFPLPSDASLVVEITHFDAETNPVFTHTFTGWVAPTPFRKATIGVKSAMAHTINLRCEEVKLFSLLSAPAKTNHE